MMVVSNDVPCVTEWGSTKTGEQEQLIVTALNCVLRVPRYIPQEQRFDVRVLVRRSGKIKTSLNHFSKGLLPTWVMSFCRKRVFCCVYQGLGLLINLVEYSSRNRHGLVDMEFYVDETCLEDSLMQPTDQTPADTAVETAPPSTADIQGEGTGEPKPSGALGALVKVGTVTLLGKGKFLLTTHNCSLHPSAHFK